jgi:hypothetical protein
MYKYLIISFSFALPLFTFAQIREPSAEYLKLDNNCLALFLNFKKHTQ